MKNLLALLLFLASFYAAAQEDAIVLKNGQTINCTIIEKQDSSLRINLNGATLEFGLSRIEYYKMNYIWYNVDGTKRQDLNAAYSPVHAEQEKIIKLQDQVDYMRGQLTISHNIFVAGVVIDVLGTLALFGGLSLNESYITYAGAGALTIGNVLMLSSHHWIGKAGIGIGGKGVKVKYIF